MSGMRGGANSCCAVLVLVVGAVALSGCDGGGQAALAPASPLPGNTVVRTLLWETLAESNSPALAAAIVSRDGEEVAEVVGVLRYGEPEPATPQSLFHIASCTKAMTATLCAILVQQGVLGWDTTVGALLPDLLGPHPDEFRRVTVHQLLTHQAGIIPCVHGTLPPGSPDLGWREILRFEACHGERRDVDLRREFVKCVLARQRWDTPTYSNAGYTVAAAMAEKVTRSSWEDLMASRLLTPLRMTSADYGWPPTCEAGQPWGHRMVNGTPQPSSGANEDRVPRSLRPAAGLHCTIHDLASFAGMHLRGLTGGGEMLPSHVIAFLHEPAGWVEPAGAMHYGCGWIAGTVAGLPVTTHTGNTDFFTAQMTISRDVGWAVVVATNRGLGGLEPCSLVTERLLRLAAEVHVADAPVANEKRSG